MGYRYERSIDYERFMGMTYDPYHNRLDRQFFGYLHSCQVLC